MCFGLIIMIKEATITSIYTHYQLSVTISCGAQNIISIQESLLGEHIFIYAEKFTTGTSFISQTKFLVSVEVVSIHEKNVERNASFVNEQSSWVKCLFVDVLFVINIIIRTKYKIIYVLKI